MHAAMRRGFLVSKPFGDSAGYDVVVDSRRQTSGVSRRLRKLWTVQVRCVTHRIGRSFKVSTRCGAGRRKMTPADADFLAAYTSPHDRWYVIPVRAFAPANHISLFPHVEGSEGKWEKYREAWELFDTDRVIGKSGNRGIENKNKAHHEGHEGYTKARCEHSAF